MAIETTMNIHILAATPDAEKICAAAAGQCYSPDNASELIWKLTDFDVKKRLAHCIKSGHLAVLANAHAVISVNVSRSTLTQMNTHAHIKTLTQSQQYIDHRDFRYHLPQAMKGDSEAVHRFRELMWLIQKEYNWFRSRGYKPEDAREILPNAAEANTVLSGNFWGWFNFLERRVCKRNTPQTLELAQTILSRFRILWPGIFNYCGAPCEFGRCKELKPCGSPYKPGEVS